MRFKGGKMFSCSFRGVLTSVLALQMTLAPSLTAYAQTNSQAPISQSKAQESDQIDPFKKMYNDTLERLRQEDPIWREFLKIQAEADPFVLKFDRNDPAIDKDPYFLRSQSWVTSTATSGGVNSKIGEKKGSQNKDFIPFFKGDTSVTIGLPESGADLKIDQALAPFALTEEFLFLSLDKNSDLFQQAAGRGEKPGEGLFFINRSELQERAQLKQPVPIYFFPLPGQGWTGPIISHEVSKADILAVANQNGDAVSIDLGDVEKVNQAQQINLLLATASSNKDTTFDGTKFPYPAPGTTAAFGLFFTGDGRGFQVSSLEKATSWLLSKTSKIPLLNLFHSQNAQATSLSPDFIPRLIYVGSILTGMLALSIVLKYGNKGIKGRLKGLYADQPKKKSVFKKLGQEIREVFDVYAHVTTTSHQLQTVGFGNFLEFFTDRFAPAITAADHTLIRRFMNVTFLFSRDSIMRSPVNAKTFFLGAIVMGSMSTSFIALQYFVVVPWLCQTVSHFLSPAWQQKVDTVYSPNNPNTAQIATSDTLRKGLSLLQSGASSYSADSRYQIIEGVITQVEAQMRKMGKDPKHPANLNMRQEMIDKTTDMILQQTGLHSADEFLFDANSLFGKIPKALGYAPPESMAGNDSFILAKRFGLTRGALKRSIRHARAFALKNPSAAAEETVKILEETFDNMGFLKNRVKKGVEGYAYAQKVRQELTLLSYEGPLAWSVKYLPETWVVAHEGSAVEAASLFFRQSLYSLLYKEGHRILTPAPDSTAKFELAARKTVLDLMHNEDPALAKLEPSEAYKSIVNEKTFELEVRTQLEIMEMARKHAVDVEIDTYVRPKQDAFTQWQLDKADRKTNEKMGKGVFESTALQGVQLDGDSYRELHKKYYREALGEQVGLRLLSPKTESYLSEEDRTDYREMMLEVERLAEETTQSEIEYDPGLKHYLSGLSEVERRKIEVSMYSVNFLSAYQSATTQKQMVGPLSPAQPGKFQILRQTKWVHSSAFLTRTLRTLESFMDDQTLSLGFHESLRRNIPLFSDLWSTHRRLLKKFIPAMTLGYLWNYHVWQLHIPYAAWTIFMLSTALTNDGPSQWLNRVFRMNGIKVMDNWRSKALSTIPYGWITFFGMIPITLFSKDANVLFTEHVHDPFLSWVGQVDPQHWQEALIFIGSSIVAKKLISSWKSRRQQVNFHKEMTEAIESRMTNPNPTLHVSVRCRKALNGIHNFY